MSETESQVPESERVETKVSRPQFQLIDKVNSQRDSIGLSCPSFGESKRKSSGNEVQDSERELSDYGTV